MTHSFDTVVLGAGPAGTGPLIAAIQRGDHERLLQRGVLWIDRSEGMVGGTIGQHDILSDTASDVLLECLKGQDRGPFRAMLADPRTDEVKAHAGGPLPLGVAGRYLSALGRIVRGMVEQSGRSAFLGATTVTSVDAHGDGFDVHASTPDGPRAFAARRIVMALGGEQSPSALLAERLAGPLTLGDFAHKTLISSALVTLAGQASMRERLQASADPRLTIVGSSHSAVTAAWLALHRSGASFAEGAVHILCRRPPKLFYPSRAAARADGYLAWSERDVCPVTGRVFRLAGLRLSARDLMRSVWGLGDIPREKRVVVRPFDPLQDEVMLREELAGADVVVAAFGYAPRLVPVLRNGAPLRLLAHTRWRAPLVDGQCRILLDNGEPLPDAYGMGLASGFVPHGAMGGEPSFDGQTNGLWLYQNDIGAMVLAHMLR